MGFSPIVVVVVHAASMYSVLEIMYRRRPLIYFYFYTVKKLFILLTQAMGLLYVMSSLAVKTSLLASTLSRSAQPVEI